MMYNYIHEANGRTSILPRHPAEKSYKKETIQ